MVPKMPVDPGSTNSQDGADVSPRQQIDILLENRDDSFDAFDWSLYSALVRKDRKDKGFKTAEAFSATIYRRTRVNISRDSVYKIEQGKQTPDALQFMAINIALYNEPMPHRITSLCFCPEWDQMIGYEGSFPVEWAHENFRAAAGEDASNPYVTAQEVAARVGDDSEYFANPNPQPPSSIYDDDIPF